MMCISPLEEKSRIHETIFYEVRYTPPDVIPHRYILWYMYTDLANTVVGKNNCWLRNIQADVGWQNKRQTFSNGRLSISISIPRHFWIRVQNKKIPLKLLVRVLIKEQNKNNPNTFASHNVTQSSNRMNGSFTKRGKRRETHELASNTRNQLDFGLLLLHYVSKIENPVSQ